MGYNIYKSQVNKNNQQFGILVTFVSNGNALLPIFPKDHGIDKSASEVHSSNARDPRDLTDEGIETCFKFWQWPKA